MVIGGSRRGDGVLCCPSPLGQHLLRASSFPAAPCLNINCLKLSAHKCDLFLQPQQFMDIQVPPMFGCPSETTHALFSSDPGELRAGTLTG